MPAPPTGTEAIGGDETATIAYVVETVYKQYLGRLPTAAEFARWTTDIGAGTACLGHLETAVLHGSEFLDTQRLPRAGSGGAYASQPLAGTCAVVTGGSSGIGFATALELAAAGARVMATSRTRNVFDEHVALAQADGMHLCEAATVSTAAEWTARCEAAEWFGSSASPSCAARAADFAYRGVYMLPTSRRHFYSGRSGVAPEVLARISHWAVDHRDYAATRGAYEHARDVVCGGRAPDVVVVNPTTWSTPFHRPTSRPTWSTNSTRPRLSDESIVARTPDRYTNTSAQTTQHNALMYDNIVFAFHATFGEKPPGGAHFAFVDSPTAYWHPYGALFANEHYFRGKADGVVLATQMKSQSATTGIRVSQAFPYYLRSDMVYQDLLEQSGDVEGGPLTWPKGTKGAGAPLGLPDHWAFWTNTQAIDLWGSRAKLGYFLPATIIAKLILRQVVHGEESSLHVPNLPFTSANRGIYALLTYLPEVGFDAAADTPGPDAAAWLDAEFVQHWSSLRMLSSAALYGTGTESLRAQTWTYGPPRDGAQRVL